MPVGKFGQLITFAVEFGGDFRFSGYDYVSVTKTLNTIRKIAVARGHKEDEREVARLNGVRSVTAELKRGRRIRVPDRLSEEQVVHVLAGDTPPVITAGYANIGVVARSERAGLSVFTGYDPWVMSVPIRFESEDMTGSWHGADGTQIEADIEKLEKMAGRGHFPGSAVGPPPIIHVSVTGASDQDVPLIPLVYQRTTHNKDGPLWWISNIVWDADGLRNDKGQRIRQLAEVTLTQYVTPDVLEEAGAAARGNATNTTGSNKPQVKTFTTGVRTP